jgi:ankyrin repeat protein
MKLKLLISTAIGIVLVAAVVVFSIGRYGSSQNKVNNGLYRACSTGNAAAAAYWLAKGADINQPDPGSWGQTPLAMCAHLNAETVELLLLLGADPNAVDKKGIPLIFNATDGYVANKLVLYGADVQKTNKEGLTALQWRQKNNYIMDDQLKVVLEGNGPAAKVREESRRMVEEAKKEEKLKKEPATQP